MRGDGYNVTQNRKKVRVLSSRMDFQRDGSVGQKKDKKTKQDTLSRHTQPTLRPWQPIRMHQHTQEHVQDTVPQKKPTRIDPVHHHRLFLLGQGR